jgi:hypothetical protein
VQRIRRMPEGAAALVVETAGDLTGFSIDDHGCSEVVHADHLGASCGCSPDGHVRQRPTWDLGSEA